ncbi:methyltransferase [Brumimicrobium salinarum]|uniref:Methyltransferase n=1 Tax=Brumimicrobium salinarum TaxID=2058658 RepID=A0A2I0R364_9FLAO|nr:class I SAM-dependent methyltransferase [Brumimicrobium salinarum]PKR81005.1 methyltransferase [Brumimicrobium salinarum]
MEFLKQELEDYVNAHTSNESDTLAELNRQTHIKVLQPRMLSGHLQGRTLSMFSKMIRPKRILEIGTYTGYSAICLAEGLDEDGMLLTLDVNYELEDMVNEYINKAGYSNKIKMIVGDAMEIVPTLDLDFDLVFIDADKTNYSNYYDLLIKDLPSGSIIIADNVLWSGKVIAPTKKNDKDTEALKIFNQKIQDDPRVENVLMPIRDGLMVIRKK